MNYMEEHYGNENFIGLAVHCDDRMEASSYKGFINNFILSSYPGCIINRTRVTDPSAEMLEKNYRQMATEMTYASVECSAVSPDLGDENMEVSASLRFSSQLENANLKLSFVLTEDGVGPYPQQNTYSSGMLGPMGGWESKGGYVLTYYDHVVVQAVDCLGIPESVPSFLETGKVYTFTCPVSLANIKDINKCTLVAMLIDGDTREIVNAAKLHLAEAAVSEMKAESEPLIIPFAGGFRIEGDYRDGTVYSVDGKRIHTLHGESEILLPSGIYIISLRISDSKLSKKKIII